MDSLCLFLRCNNIKSDDCDRLTCFWCKITSYTTVHHLYLLTNASRWIFLSITLHYVMQLKADVSQMWRPYGVSQRLDPIETIKLSNEAQTIRGGAASHMGTGAGSSIHSLLCVSVVGVALVSISVLWSSVSLSVFAVLSCVGFSVAALTTTSCFFYGKLLRVSCVLLAVPALIVLQSGETSAVWRTE